MIEGEDVKDPERTGCLQLASGGGVLVLNLAAPAVTQVRRLRENRRKQLPTEGPPALG